MTKAKSFYLADPSPARGKVYLTTADLCRRYNCGPSTLARRRQDPAFPKAVQLGGISSPNLFDEDEVDAYDAMRREAALSAPPRQLPSRAYKAKSALSAALADGDDVTAAAEAARDTPTPHEPIITKHPLRQRYAEEA